TYESLAEFTDALRAYRKVCELAPQDRESLRDLGRLLERLERFDEAVEIYRNLTDVEPSSAAFLQLGNALRADGRRGEAIDAYQQAWSKSPDNAEILANLAQTAAEVCSWNERQSHIDRLLAAIKAGLAQDLPGPLSPSAALTFGISADLHLAVAR